MKIYLSFLLIFIISSCSKIPTPSLITPSENRNIQAVSFGTKPDNYQSILKDYLINNLKNYKTAKVEFINAPSKISIDHLGSNYTGYRVCLSINEKKGDYYIGYKNHFFLISDNNVSLHLFDSGLLKIPFEYCVSRSMDKEIFIDDIPDTKDDISIVGMDKVKIASRDELKYKKLETEIEKLKQENNELRKLDESNSNNIEKSQKQLAKIETTKNPYKEDDNTYILCSFDNKEMTYIFNAVKKTFRLVNKLDTVSYTVSFNEAYIVASNEALELTINRVSGKATYENKTLNKGLCELTDQTKF